MKNRILLLTLLALINTSCSKDWLDKKPLSTQVVPTTIRDAQALTDDISLNTLTALGEISADDYYVNNVSALTQAVYRNAYTWQADTWEGATQSAWNNNYKAVFTANVAIETLDKITPNASNVTEYNTALGCALFLRGISFFDIANHYSVPFNAATAASELGIPLRLNANVNEVSARSTLAETYAQIIADFKRAAWASPVTPLYRTRSSKPAAYAMLAKVYLNMEDYGNATLYADSCLQLQSTLMNYNSMSLSSTLPFALNNVETIYFSYGINWPNLREANLIVAPELYTMYAPNDLRRTAFFYTNAGNLTRKGSYTGSTGTFFGIGTDEIFLIRAEGYVRTARLSLGIADLQTLMANRLTTGATLPTAVNVDDALKLILNERRKELVYRGLRWQDLRRLNKDSRFAKTLTRVYNSVTYSIAPNDKRYTFALPEIEIQKYGLQQNPR